MEAWLRDRNELLESRRDRRLEVQSPEECGSAIKVRRGPNAYGRDRDKGASTPGLMRKRIHTRLDAKAHPHPA
eukprot:356621-Chlamydomonas_euryale.AAC.3